MMSRFLNDSADLLHRSRPLAFLLVFVVSTLVAGSAGAWKPSTHVYLALQAIAEIDATVGLDGEEKGAGNIVIYRVDHVTGDIVGRIGEYPAASELLEALAAHEDDFIAGVLGPDAYPDIATGQTRIHVEDPRHTDLWMQYLWEQAQDGSAPVRAFTAGYLFHAAGDMFMHTFVNYYAGGPFTFKTLNGERHVVLESYIGERAPRLDLSVYDLALSSDVLDFIYETLVDARAGTYLGDQLLIEQPLTEPMAQGSIPRLFSTWRNFLQAHVDWFDGEVAAFDEYIDEIYRRHEEQSCGGKTCQDSDRSSACVAACALAAAEAVPIAAQKDAFVALRGADASFARDWIDDIDTGLRAWPTFSHDIARLVIFNPDGMDLQAARDRADQYRNEHLLAMLGAPDAVGGFLGFVQSIKEMLGFTAVEEQLRMLRESALDYILLETYGWTAEEFRERFVSPTAQFDEVLNLAGYTYDPVNQEEVAPITLAHLNQEVLDLPDVDGFGDETWDVHAFRPAYNTITMTKLILMSPESIEQLRDDLGCAAGTCEPFDNAMLGFIRSLDDDNQWRNDPSMVFGKCVAYSQIFKRQTGEEVHCPPPLPLAAPAIAPGDGTYAQPTPLTLSHPMPEASLYYTISEVDAPVEPDPEHNRTHLYTGPFTLSAPLTGPVRPFVVRARAYRDGFTPSASAAAEITIDARAAAPQIDPAGGAFIEPLEVRLVPAPGTTVYYTLNGQSPDYNASVYTGPIQLGKGQHELQAIAYQIQLGASEVISATFDVFDASTERADVPVLFPRSSGDFVDEVEVRMLSHTQGAEIRYTVAQDGVPPEPTASSALYTGPFTLGLGNWFVRAVAFKEGLFPSELNQRNYRVGEAIGVTLSPEITPNGGTFNNAVEVTLSAATDPPTQGVQIFYTADASEPEIDPQQAGNYREPFTVSQSTTVKAQATRRFFSPSSTVEAEFRLECAPPEIEPGGGTFLDSVAVRLRTATEDATIRYTLDGSAPHEESEVYGGPLVLDRSTTIRARAFKRGYFFSEDRSSTVVVTTSTRPFVVQQPADASVVVGEPALFVAAAGGQPAPTMQWQFEGEGLEGATDDSLRLPSAQLDDAGTYRAVLTSSSGVDTTRAARLQVDPTPVAPEFVMQPEALVVKQGEAAAIGATARGTPAPGYVWFRNGRPLVGQTASTISFEDVQLVHAGEYSVIATNSAGADTSRAVQLTVETETSVNTVEEDGLPEAFALHQNYPNPFNPSTTIPFSLPEAASVTVRLFDVAGRQIALLVNEEMAAGHYELVFNGEGLASGAYFYQMKAGDYISSKAMLFVK